MGHSEATASSSVHTRAGQCLEPHVVRPHTARPRVTRPRVTNSHMTHRAIDPQCGMWYRYVCPQLKSRACLRVPQRRERAHARRDREGTNPNPHQLNHPCVNRGNGPFEESAYLVADGRLEVGTRSVPHAQSLALAPRGMLSGRGRAYPGLPKHAGGTGAAFAPGYGHKDPSLGARAQGRA